MTEPTPPTAKIIRHGGAAPSSAAVPPNSTISSPAQIPAYLARSPRSIARDPMGWAIGAPQRSASPGREALEEIRESVLDRRPPSRFERVTAQNWGDPIP